MSIKLDLVSPSGNRKGLTSALDIKTKTEYGIQRGLWRSGKDIKAEFNRQVLAKNKRGRLYIRRNRAGARRRHRASAPGQTPANMTGQYRKGAGFSVRSKELAFGNTAEHAGFLELGTQRMKARPGLRNAISASQRDIIRNLAGDIKEAI